MPTLDFSKQDCERLASMLDIHVRPVYYRAANAKGEFNGSVRTMGAESLAHCDRLADIFRAAYSDTPTPVKEA
jgi:hypothetical protein